MRTMSHNETDAQSRAGPKLKGRAEQMRYDQEGLPCVF